MAFSVNTNAGAFAALQNLSKTSSSLQNTQSSINTGLKVSSAKDDAATFAIAQKLRGDVAGLNAVKSSLDRATSTVDVAIAAGEAVSDLLIELKEKAVAAKDSGLDTASRTSLNNDFSQLRSQITSIVSNAEFNGSNVVNSSGDAVVAITNDTGSNVISIAAQDLSVGGANVTLTGTQSIGTETAAALVVTAIESSIANVNDALSALGSGAKRIELQRSFVDKLSDTIEVGIGNLVDADLAKESANLQALQVKQQLGLQALSIANQAPSTVLGLFR
ncbi:flagellin [Kordiimonas sp.]|uniref:flagellin n=1 Tax=Kordiimonas sp. TaxID=1970157 RepID=UPI003A91B009|eukprot:TRINITY_DN4428_c0_g1_i1.p1 TRINITY_DN4428_c0_g1~~TRINITY_DN4428_c0_g1_i1.p1  ORF type:complete len:276 (+),score=19.30 TRINITY_DN4428_c0_g1_i1:264-1091(+)